MSDTSPSFNNSLRLNKGFTLVEVLVSIAILAVGLGMVVIGFGQLADRDLDNQATIISRWLESLSDRSVLEGGLYGFRVMGNQLQAVSWFDHQWFVVEHESGIELPNNISFAFTEDEQPVGFISVENLQELDQQSGFADIILLEDDQIEPLMVFMPSGQPMLDGNLMLESGDASVIVTWDADEGVNFAETSI